MAGGQKRRTTIGGFRVNLFDSRGRFTSNYRNARFFSVVSDNKADSKRREFPQEATKANEKESYVGYAVSSIFYQRDREAIERQKRYVKETEKKRVSVKERKKEYGGREEKFLKEIEKIDPKFRKRIVEEIAKRRERRKVGAKPKKTPKELRGISDRELDARAYKIAGELMRAGNSIHPEIEDDYTSLVHAFFEADLSTEGQRTKVEQVKSKTGKLVWKHVAGDEGNPFAIAQQEGISEENHLWSIVRNYLRQLGYEHFNNLARKKRKNVLSLGVILSTNIKSHPDHLRTQDVATFIANLRDDKKTGRSQAQVQKDHMDHLTYRIVRAIVQTTNQTGAEVPSEYSLLSSGKSLVLRLSKPSRRGAMSMKTKNIKIIFTLFCR
jgi:hypothetical protein